MKPINDQFIWVLAYIDKDHIDKLQRELDKNNQYIGIEAQIPTVKVLKKQFKGKEHFDNIPLLFNYGFFKIPILWAMSYDLLDKIRKDISCISHWVKDPAKVYLSHTRADLTKTQELGSKDVPCATVRAEDVMRLIKYAQEESIHSSNDIDELKTDSIVTLMAYPFEGMEAKVVEVDKKHKKVKVLLRLDMTEGENEFADKITTVSFDNVFYSIYRGAYHEDYNKEKTLTDYQSKTKTGSYDDEN